MRVTFIGVGEAFDENLPNTSVLVREQGRALLLDCGFTAAQAFWRYAENPLELEGVWISHFHGDHYFGIPALLVRSIEEGRTSPLTIVGQPGVSNIVLAAMHLAYPGTLSKAEFEVRFLEAVEGKALEASGFQLTFAPSSHPSPCLAVRVKGRSGSLFYSGDGRPTDESLDLAGGCSLIVHEAFALEADYPGHGTVDGALGFARSAGAGALALVHVQRRVRRTRASEIRARLDKAGELRAFLPEPGQTLDI